MFRKTFIAAATVAALGAGSLAPASAAVVNLGGVAAAQTDASPTVQVRHDGRRDRNDRGRDYRRRGRDDHRGHGYHRGYRRGQVCQVRPTRVVEWTPRGKVVRVIRQETCFFGGRRWR